MVKKNHDRQQETWHSFFYTFSYLKPSFMPFVFTPSNPNFLLFLVHKLICTFILPNCSLFYLGIFFLRT
jgi:hypothetical protein